MLLRFTSVLLFSILFSVKASAIERCDCTVSQFRDAGDFRDYMHEVAIFGKVEHRKTVTEFATATGQDPNVVDQKYSATGDLSCAGKGGTAQVTIKNNLITTSAHALFNPKTCVPIASPSGCTFTLKNIKGDVQKIKVKELLATGIKCPPATPDLDWAVLRLDMPAVGVSPYAVEASPAKGLKEHAKVTFVAHSMDFWRKDASGNKIFPKHIQKDCEIQKVYSSFEPIYYGADCDAASFASGGSLLNELPNGQVILSGILKGGPGTEEQDEQSRETGEKLMGPYADRTYAGYYIPVAGDFLRAINKAAE